MMSGRRTSWAACGPIAIASLLTAFPSVAWALCPNCLGQTRTLTPTLELLGIFLLVPFAVAYVVFRAIRHALREER